MTTNALELIQQIIAIEWAQFSKVQNAGGPANCQNKPSTFCAMRAIQASIWQDQTLMSYLHDLNVANNNSHNLMTEKYARMMAITHPDEYQSIKSQLPVIAIEKQQLVDEIMKVFTRWEVEVINSVGKNNITSFHPEAALIYLRNELLTYSLATLQLCLHDVEKANNSGCNLVKDIFEKTLTYYQTQEASNAVEQPQNTGSCNSNKSVSATGCGCGCRACGVEVPIDNTMNLSQISAELLDYNLPSFYDEHKKN